MFKGLHREGEMVRTPRVEYLKQSWSINLENKYRLTVVTL